MKCVACGAEFAEDVKFCTLCGAPVPAQEEPPVVPPPTAPIPTYVSPAPPAPVNQNRPLSPWAYYGLQLLFSIPLVGFICLIIFSFDNGNINRRNFARSYWCGLIVSVAVIVLLIILLVASGAGAALLSEIERLPLY